MDAGQRYIQTLSSHLGQLDQQAEALAVAAGLLADAQQEGRLIHLFGTEPSLAALSAEFFFQPGALMNIDPILDPSLDPAHGAYRSAMCLKLEGLAPCILDYYESIEPGDPILLLGSDPSLPMFSEALRWSKRRGLSTIVVISRAADAPICRADVTLCTGATFDAGPPEHTILSAALLHLLLLEVQARLQDPQAHTWSGGRFVDLAKDRADIDRLLFRIRHL